MKKYENLKILQPVKNKKCVRAYMIYIVKYKEISLKTSQILKKMQGNGCKLHAKCKFVNTHVFFWLRICGHFKNHQNRFFGIDPSQSNIAS